jgi:hypothetical protein
MDALPAVELRLADGCEGVSVRSQEMLQQGQAHIESGSAVALELW